VSISDRGTDIIADENANQMQNPFNLVPEVAADEEKEVKRTSTADFLGSSNKENDRSEDDELDDSSVDAGSMQATLQQCKCKATVLIVDDN
jgi:hypothetical protein